ncbi:hypothetical protein GGR52DRAFT_554600 [Hypoxylon sp. FL1284]|nr:hypothetical protein GGR52DRAFT_554600 [Hypoxylon sp. FL1284]
MAPSPITENYYAILEITRTVDAETLKAAWRRLARIKHPDKNPGNPNATAEFQLLESAYSTLSDPTRRKAYDIQFPTTFTSSGPTTGAYYHGYASKANNDPSEQKNREREARRSRLDDEVREKQSDIAEADQKLRRILEQIGKLDEDAKMDVAEEPTWWGYFTSVMPGSREARAERARERDRRGLDRIAAKRIKERELGRQRDKVAQLEAALRATRFEINKITQEIRRWNEEQEAARQREAQKQREENLRQARARREAEAERQREAQRRREEEQRQEKVRREQDAERRREAQRQQREEQARRERARREEKAAKAAKEAAEEAADFKEWHKKERERAARVLEESQRKQKEKDETACAHKGWWNKIDGRYRCSNCSKRTPRFALQCPRCERIACAACRKVLQKDARREGRSGGDT